MMLLPLPVAEVNDPHRAAVATMTPQLPCRLAYCFVEHDGPSVMLDLTIGNHPIFERMPSSAVRVEGAIARYARRGKPTITVVGATGATRLMPLMIWPGMLVQLAVRADRDVAVRAWLVVEVEAHAVC